MNNLKALIAEQKGKIRRFDVNLADVITNQETNIGGNLFTIWSAPSRAEYVLVSFNDPNADQIELHRGQSIITPYTRIFLTVPPGQAGNMTILYGTDSPEVLRANAESENDMLDSILRELQGDMTPDNWGNATIGAAAAVQVLAANQNRIGFELQAGLGNTGTIYIGYSNTVTINNAVKGLVAGQSFWQEHIRATIWAIATGAGQVLHFTEV